MQMQVFNHNVSSDDHKQFHSFIFPRVKSSHKIHCFEDNAMASAQKHSDLILISQVITPINDFSGLLEAAFKFCACAAQTIPVHGATGLHPPLRGTRTSGIATSPPPVDREGDQNFPLVEGWHWDPTRFANCQVSSMFTMSVDFVFFDDTSFLQYLQELPLLVGPWCHAKLLLYWHFFLQERCNGQGPQHLRPNEKVKGINDCSRTTFLDFLTWLVSIVLRPLLFP